MQFKFKVACAAGLLCSAMVSSVQAADLISVYNQALQNDPTFRQAEATWLAGKEGISIARAALLPQIAGTAQYNYNDNYVRSNPGAPNATSKFWSGGYALTLDQAIFNYNSWFTYKNASAAVKSAEATYNKASQTLIVTTVGDYTKVLSDYATLLFQKAQVRYLLQKLRSTQQQYRVGLVAVTDVYDIESTYDSAISAEISDQNTLSNDLETLRALTGNSYKSLRGIKGIIPLQTPRPNNIEQWSQRSLQQNYDVLAARYSAQAARDTVQASIGSLLPQVGLHGSYGQTDNHGDSPAVRGGTTSSIGVQLSVPLFSGGANYATLHQNRYQLEAAQSALTLAERSAVSATRQDYLSVIADISAVKANRQATKSSREALNSNEAGYRVGTRTITNVLDAIQQLYQSEQNEASSQYKYITDMVNLKADVGTLSLKDVKTVNRLLNTTFNFSRPLERGHTYAVQSGATKKLVKHVAAKSKAKAPTVSMQQHLGQPAKLYTLKKHYYVIQFYAGGDLKHAKNFILNRAHKHSLSIVKLTKNSSYNYKVVHGWYASPKAARSALLALPTQLKNFKPWITRLSPGDKVMYGLRPGEPAMKYASHKTKHSAAKTDSSKAVLPHVGSSSGPTPPTSGPTPPTSGPNPATPQPVPAQPTGAATATPQQAVPPQPAAPVQPSATPPQQFQLQPTPPTAPATQQSAPAPSSAPQPLPPTMPAPQQSAPAQPVTATPPQPAAPVQPPATPPQHFQPQPLPPAPSSHAPSAMPHVKSKATA